MICEVTCDIVRDNFNDPYGLIEGENILVVKNRKQASYQENM